jgi:serine/threonine protein kinase
VSLATGQVIQNRYRIVKRIATGGFGAIYKAWDLNLGRLCAVKENLETTPEAQRQFGQEARILANLSHPNLPRVTDHFSIPGQGQYLVMDYVDGEDLQEMLDRAGGPLPEAQVLPWIDQVCEALSYLHAQNPPVIHRDIKPANIRITPQGKPMLVDFGIAKKYDPSKKTTAGARGVTPGYSPPEQYGTGATDARSDEYALGATLYALLTGQTPPDSVDIITRQAPPLRPIRQVNPGIRQHVSDAVIRAMELDPVRRYPRLADFRDALQNTIQVVPGYPARPSIYVGTAPVPPVSPPPQRPSIYVGTAPVPPVSPPPQSPVKSSRSSSTSAMITCMVIAGVLLCCIAAFVLMWNYGDAIFGLTGQSAASSLNTPVSLALTNTAQQAANQGSQGLSALTCL